MVRLVAEQQGEYDYSRYASRYASVTPDHYRGFDKQEPTLGEGGESERFIACSIQAKSHRLPGVRLRGAAVSRDVTTNDPALRQVVESKEETVLWRTTVCP